MNRQTKARTRQKVRKLRQRRRMLAVHEARLRKKAVALEKEIKGKTVQEGVEAKVATYLPPDIGRKLMDHRFYLTLNQRQKRKRRRATGVKY